jgi:putative ABC transport system permease protein
VLQNFHADDLSNEVAPYIFFYQPEMLRWANVRMAPGRLEAGMEDVRAAWMAMGHPRSVDMAVFDTQLEQNFINLMTRDMYRLIGFIALLAVTIACLGLLGIASFNVESRTREISIRKVLGADVRTLVILLSREFLILIGIATVLSMPLAWILANTWLQSFAYRIALGPGTLGLALFILLSIAATAIGSQTMKAALANPIDNLHDN